MTTPHVPPTEAELEEIALFLGAVDHRLVLRCAIEIRRLAGAVRDGGDGN